MNDPADARVVLITGAAGGIGRATAQEFAARGYRCSLVDINGEGIAELAETLNAAGCETLSLVGDLADLAFVESAVRQTHERFGRLDVLVNNAAWRELGTMRNISLASWEKTLRVCLTAPAFMARWAAEQMQPRGAGVIVNISSMMSQRAGGISPAYVAAKGGLDSLTYELAALYGPAGIRVVAINPGAIDTDLSRDYPAGGARGGDPLRAFSEDMIMLRRWAEPQEIARAVAWVASDDASYLTGTTLVIDGGWQHQHSPHSIKQRQFPHDFS